MKRISSGTSFSVIAFLAFSFFCGYSPAVSAAVYMKAAPVGLYWSPNPEPDVQGYEVHRATASGGPYTRISSEFVAGENWSDWNVSTGNTYYYKIRAVDSVGNFSALSAASEAVILSTGDFDSDGFSDDFEEQVGTDPLDSDSRPVAELLVLNPEGALLRLGDSESFSVVGLFREQAGELIEHDMTCLVAYQTQPAGIAAINACGGASAQAEGAASIWAWQLLNGAPVAATNQATITVDATPPHVDLFETQPYDGQGINEDINGNGLLDAGEDLDGDGVLDRDVGQTPRVPHDTGIIIRVVDNVVGSNIGIDDQSIQLTINGAAVPAKVRPVYGDDLHEVDIAPAIPLEFAFSQIVIVELTASDTAGNELYFRRSFRVETEAQYQWVLEHMPLTTAREIGDGRCEITITPVPDSISDEPLETARLIFNCDEPIQPRFGPMGELPPLDIATPAGVPIALEPVALFNSPVTVVVPMSTVNLIDTTGDGAPDSGLDDYALYQYSGNPAVQWRSVDESDGWLVDASRLNDYETVPPSIHLQLLRSTGIQTGKDVQIPATVVDIKVNGGDGPITVTKNDILSLTLTLSPGDQVGHFADWWLIADTPAGRYYYRRDRQKWQTRIRPAVQMPLTEVSSMEIFSGKPPFGTGDYTIRFGVDANADGNPDFDWQDTAVVQVRFR